TEKKNGQIVAEQGKAPFPTRQGEQAAGVDGDKGHWDMDGQLLPDEIAARSFRFKDRKELKKIERFFSGYKGWESYLVFYLWRSLSVKPMEG
ncbi:MAG TPA: hypothetical protein VHC48_04530, partial [Puia sp.]|nr:hypothetical protein [Puia sp.]